MRKQRNFQLPQIGPLSGWGRVTGAEQPCAVRLGEKLSSEEAEQLQVEMERAEIARAREESLIEIERQITEHILAAARRRTQDQNEDRIFLRGSNFAEIVVDDPIREAKLTIW